MKTFPVIWSRSLVITSILATAFCLGFGFFFPLVPGIGHAIPLWLGILVAASVPVCALFIVCGYTVTSGAILVHRPLWTTRFPRAGLVSVRSEPFALRGSLRFCGMGGLFSYTGYFWNKKLGRFRAFVTDPSRTVVLRWEKNTVVISPAEPEDFRRALAEL